MAILSNMLARAGGAAAGAARGTAAPLAGQLSSYVQGFGILGSMVTGAVGGAAAGGKTGSGGARSSGIGAGSIRARGDNETFSGIHKTLVSIDSTLKGILNLQQKQYTESKYAAEGFAQPQASLSTVPVADVNNTGRRQGWMGTFLKIAVVAFTTIVGVVKGLFKNLFSFLKPLFIGAINLLKNGLQSIFDFLKNGVLSVLEKLKDIFFPKVPVPTTGVPSGTGKESKTKKRRRPGARRRQAPPVIADVPGKRQPRKKRPGRKKISMGERIRKAAPFLSGLLTNPIVLGAAGIAGVAGLIAYMVSKDRGAAATVEEAQARQVELLRKPVAPSPEELSASGVSIEGLAQSDRVGGLPGVLDEMARANVPKGKVAEPLLGLPNRVIPRENISRLSGDKQMGGINYSSYKEAVGERESGGDYKEVNSLGYLGKYQMGVSALIDQGLMKPILKGKTNLEQVNNPENWRAGFSKDEFLNNPGLQEDVMRRYTLQNYKTGVKMGVIKDTDSPSLIAAKLASAHLLGWGKKNPTSNKEKGARQYWEGGDHLKDAYGTLASTYASIGRMSQSRSAIGNILHQETGEAWRSIRSDMPPVMNQAISTDAKSQAAASLPLIVNNLSTPPVVVNAPGGGNGGGASSITEIPTLDSSHLNLNSLYYFAP